MSVAILEAEWDRLELLCRCLQQRRRDGVVPDDAAHLLGQHQKEVLKLRGAPPWRPLASEHGLDPLDLELLACAVAPDAAPHLGWLYQELQPGITSPYPTPALMHELSFSSPLPLSEINTRLAPAAPLMRARLLHPLSGNYQPMRATPQARSRLLGSTESPGDIPGAHLANAAAKWDDLIVPPWCKRAIEEFTWWTLHRSVVSDGWGVQIHGGATALFHGPSGTGKTLAAEVVANALGRPLYRVNLGNLVSKYIGETEKNLSALFEATSALQCVLLFDEAETVFGKRGDVRDARDRYANMEVSHLLSCIERQQDLCCVLTTNLPSHLDSAFARRFQAVIEFPRPSARDRARLWKHHLPGAEHIAPEIQVEELGSAIDLTGGQIRNAALHSAFLAVGQRNDSQITLRDITSAIWTELGKGARERTTASLGPLAKYFCEEVA